MPRRERLDKPYQPADSFARILRDRREELNMTLHDVGKSAGFKSGDYISLIETGKRTPRLNSVPKLEQALGLDPGKLCRDWIRTFHPLAAEALRIPFPSGSDDDDD